MNPLISIAIIFAVSLIGFLYALDLALFVFRENKRFVKEKMSRIYQSELQKKMKQIRHPQKKNYLLSLYLESLQACEAWERAQALLPLLRADPILGIKRG